MTYINLFFTIWNSRILWSFRGIALVLSSVIFAFLGGADIGSGDNFSISFGGVAQVRAAWTSAAVSDPISDSVLSASVNNPRDVYRRRSTIDVPGFSFFASGEKSRFSESNDKFFFLFGISSVPVSASSYGDLSGSSSSGSQMSMSDSILGCEKYYNLFDRDARVSFAVGQQLIPFGLDVGAVDSVRPVIKLAQYVSPLGVGVRQIGFFVRSWFPSDLSCDYSIPPVISVSVGVVNGNGPGQDDDNGRKDVVFRASSATSLDCLFNGYFQVGVSGYWGWSTLFDSVGGLSLESKDRYGIDLCFMSFPYGFTAEHVIGRDGLSSGLVRCSRGDVVTIFRCFGDRYLLSEVVSMSGGWRPRYGQVFIRFDRWRGDIAILEDGSDVYTTGVNLFFTSRIKSQFNVLRKELRLSDDIFISHEIIAQVQYSF